MPLRKSHENPAVKELYDTYLGKPLGHKSHQALAHHLYLAFALWKHGVQEQPGSMGT